MAYYSVCNIMDHGNMKEFRQKIKNMTHLPKDDDKNTLLHYAAMIGNLEMVRYLIEQCHCQYIPENNYGETPYYNAVYHGNLPIIQYLDQRSDQRYQTYKNNNLPIHIAAERGHMNIVKYLLDHNKDFLKKVNIHKRTPLQLALYNGHVSLAKEILTTEYTWEDVKIIILQDLDSLMEICFNIDPQILLHNDFISSMLKWSSKKIIKWYCQKDPSNIMKMWNIIVSKRDYDYIGLLSFFTDEFKLEITNDNILSLILLLPESSMILHKYTRDFKMTDDFWQFWKEKNPYFSRLTLFYNLCPFSLTDEQFADCFSIFTLDINYADMMYDILEQKEEVNQYLFIKFLESTLIRCLSKKFIKLFYTKIIQKDCLLSHLCQCQHATFLIEDFLKEKPNIFLTINDLHSYAIRENVTPFILSRVQDHKKCTQEQIFLKLSLSSTEFIIPITFLKQLDVSFIKYLTNCIRKVNSIYLENIANLIIIFDHYDFDLSSLVHLIDYDEMNILLSMINSSYIGLFKIFNFAWMNLLLDFKFKPCYYEIILAIQNKNVKNEEIEILLNTFDDLTWSILPSWMFYEPMIECFKYKRTDIAEKYILPYIDEKIPSESILTLLFINLSDHITSPLLKWLESNTIEFLESNEISSDLKGLLFTKSLDCAMFKLIFYFLEKKYHHHFNNDCLTIYHGYYDYESILRKTIQKWRINNLMEYKKILKELLSVKQCKHANLLNPFLLLPFYVDLNQYTYSDQLWTCSDDKVDFEILDWLLEYPCNPHVSGSYFKQSPLYYAARSDDSIRIFNLLVNKYDVSFDINQAKKNRSSILHPVSKSFVHQSILKPWWPQYKLDKIENYVFEMVAMKDLVKDYIPDDDLELQKKLLNNSIIEDDDQAFFTLIEKNSSILSEDSFCLGLRSCTNKKILCYLLFNYVYPKPIITIENKYILNIIASMITKKVMQIMFPMNVQNEMIHEVIQKLFPNNQKMIPTMDLKIQKGPISEIIKSYFLSPSDCLFVYNAFKKVQYSI